MQGKERASEDTIAGDPTVLGATATVFEFGASSMSQAFVLPAAVDPATGKPFWSATPTGFEYKDPRGTNGPVKVVGIKKSASGTFQIKMVALGKNGDISLAPPDPGTSGCVRLDVTGTATRYHVVLPPAPDSTVSKNDARTFLVKNAQVEGQCPLPPPVCGNGGVETGEACDGGPFCGPTCFADIPACCIPPDQVGPGGEVLPGQCTDAPGFSLAGNIMLFCGSAFPSAVGLGDTSVAPMARAAPTPSSRRCPSAASGPAAAKTGSRRPRGSCGDSTTSARGR